MKIKNYILTIFTATFLMSCGGGGGGGGFVGAALVNLDLSPNVLDTGDRAFVEIRLQETHEDGIALKVRFKDGLKYVGDSATIEIDGDESEITPLFNVDTEDDKVYLVFFFKGDRFGEDRAGIVRFQLEAISEITDGLVEVDPDVNDPTISDRDEFSVESPNFVAEDDISVEVKG